MLERFTKQTFDPLLNTVFRLRLETADGVASDLVLIETSEKNLPGLTSFSLVFRGPHTLARQGTFPLEHPALGSFDLFMTAIGADAEGMYLQAVFTRRSDVTR